MTIEPPSHKYRSLGTLIACAADAAFDTSDDPILHRALLPGRIDLARHCLNEARLNLAEAIVLRDECGVGSGEPGRDELAYGARVQRLVNAAQADVDRLVSRIADLERERAGVPQVSPIVGAAGQSLKEN